MGQYTQVGPFVNGGSPGLQDSFFNGVETALVNGGMIYFITPYHLTTNPTVNSGTTTNLTCTGGSTGVPSGAKAVLLGIGIFAATAGGYVQVYPTGATAGQYFGFNGAVANQYSLCFGIAPLSAGGQITVKANGSNIVLQDWYIYGYIV